MSTIKCYANPAIAALFEACPDHEICSRCGCCDETWTQCDSCGGDGFQESDDLEDLGWGDEFSGHRKSESVVTTSAIGSNCNQLSIACLRWMSNQMKHAFIFATFILVSVIAIALTGESE